ncbi:MAG: hypothetical protein CYG59_00670 [Chloroflexi bacterium]|nr:MAG: hypothetical protein CYG59_00670 [Chloroflexota bacterium]
MTTSAPVNIPANSTAARVLEALEKYRLKREPSGQYRADCPWQKDSDSHSLRIKIKDGEHGTWRYFAGDGDGSLYELAEKLGIEYPRTPTVKSGKGVTLDVGTSKRTYSNIADYAIQHGLTPDELSAAGIREGRHYCIDLRKSRPALLIETPTGERVRYLDGNKPEYRSPSGYTKCWYRLEIALGLCKATEQPLVICNGEISTLAAQLRGIAATALAGGSEQGIPDPLIAELKAKYDGEVLIAFDSDTTGRDGARKVARQLREAGMTVQIVDLNGPKGWDLADFVQQPGNDKPEALQSLIVREAPAEQRRRWLTEEEIEQLKPPTWLIKGFVPVGEVTIISGAGDTGKTFIAVDMMKRTAQHYRVMYVAAEDAPGVGIRKKGWDIHHKRSANGNFLMWADTFSLYDATYIDSFINEIRDMGLQMITIDTLSQVAIGADENSSNDMGVVMGNAQRIAHETGAAVVILHHNTKDNANYRGSSVIKNNTYGFLEVSKDNDTIRLECGRIKNTKPFEPRVFRLLDVPTELVDADGNPISTAVIVPADRVLRIGLDLSQDERKMLELILDATDADHGITTTELQRSLPLSNRAYYAALKRLRGLGYVTKGEKREPLTVTPEGRRAIERIEEKASPAANPAQTAGDLFEVNTRLAVTSATSVTSETLPEPEKLKGSKNDSGDGSDEGSESSNYQNTSKVKADCDAENSVTSVTSTLLPPTSESNGNLLPSTSTPLRVEVGSNPQHGELKPTDQQNLNPAVRTVIRAKRYIPEAFAMVDEILARGYPNTKGDLLMLEDWQLRDILTEIRRDKET